MHFSSSRLQFITIHSFDFHVESTKFEFFSIISALRHYLKHFTWPSFPHGRVIETSAKTWSLCMSFPTGLSSPNILETCFLSTKSRRCYYDQKRYLEIIDERAFINIDTSTSNRSSSVEVISILMMISTVPKVSNSLRRNSFQDQVNLDHVVFLKTHYINPCYPKGLAGSDMQSLRLSYRLHWLPPQDIQLESGKGCDTKPWRIVRVNESISWVTRLTNTQLHKWWQQTQIRRGESSLPNTFP